MSRWAHINGSVRIDCWSSIEKRAGYKKYVESILGKQYDFEDVLILTLKKENTETTLPMGSEGTINYTIWENPDKSAIPYMTVNIFGDLCDFGGTSIELQSVIDWFKNVLVQVDFRSAILELDTEDGYKTVLIGKYIDNTDKIQLSVVTFDKQMAVIRNTTETATTNLDEWDNIVR
jgi:hypothetical protein